MEVAKSQMLTDQFCSTIKNSPFYKLFYSKLQGVAASSEVCLQDFQKTVRTAIRNAKLETELRNEIFYWYRSHHKNDWSGSCWILKEPIDYLRKAQLQWEKRIYKSLNSMCNEIGVAPSSIRSIADRNEILEKWNALSTYDIDLSQYIPIYSPKDFVEVLLSIQNPNYNSNKFEMHSDFSHIPIKVKSLQELKEMYKELTNGQALIGVSADVITTNASLFLKLETERLSLGKKVIQYNHAPVSQEYLKKLAPHSLRNKLWSQILDSDDRQWHANKFQELQQLVGQYSLLTDNLIIKDIQLTVCNDDQYFVFEDKIYQVMLCLSRDVEMSSIFHYNSMNPILAVLKGKTSTVNHAVIYPPNGVIPFHGFAMYVAPCCYIFDDPMKLYFSIRTFYLRYWRQLHEVSSKQQGILALCILFDELFYQNEQELWRHFKSVCIQPIRIVFKWIIRCFSGHLPPEQILFLWDLILAYDSLEIIPLLAIAILSFRKENLLQVNTLQGIEAVLADLSSIRVIPLLQFVLQ